MILPCKYPIKSHILTGEIRMTDISKYKSVAVKKETHRQLKELGGPDFRSVSGVIEWLVAKEIKNRKKRKK